MVTPEKLKGKLLTPEKTLTQIANAISDTDRDWQMDGQGLHYMPFQPFCEEKGQWWQVVDKFTYLGSTLGRVVHINNEVNARIAKASAAFGWLCGSIWDLSGIRLDTKLKVYLWCCRHYYTHVKLGQFTNGMPKDWTTSIQAVLENF